MDICVKEVILETIIHNRVVLMFICCITQQTDIVPLLLIIIAGVELMLRFIKIKTLEICILGGEHDKYISQSAVLI